MCLGPSGFASTAHLCQCRRLSIGGLSSPNPSPSTAGVLRLIVAETQALSGPSSVSSAANGSEGAVATDMLHGPGRIPSTPESLSGHVASAWHTAGQPASDSSFTSGAQSLLPGNLSLTQQTSAATGSAASGGHSSVKLVGSPHDKAGPHDASGGLSGRTQGADTVEPTALCSATPPKQRSITDSGAVTMCCSTSGVELEAPQGGFGSPPASSIVRVHGPAVDAEDSLPLTPCKPSLSGSVLSRLAAHGRTADGSVHSMRSATVVLELL